jgi:magnesium chelatase subunit D
VKRIPNLSNHPTRCRHKTNDSQAPDKDTDSENQPDDSAMSDRMIEAARAALSATLLRELAAQLGSNSAAKGSQGRYGRERMSQQRGRPLAPRRGDARHGGRVHVLATVRAAAPWQPVRRELRARRAVVGSVLSPKLLVERDDWHVARRAFRSETLTIFAVDASGSAALHRLAEAKGAVELLLAECYIRRDQVALVSFRGKIADVLLPPTRSLVRAKRSLTALPGGGGTPLASGIDQAVAIAEAARRRGMTTTMVFLTDGRANVARDGTPGRPQAALDALDAAKRLRAGGYTTLMIDTSPQPQDSAKLLAEAMRGRYLGLPYAAAPVISAAVLAERAKMLKNP